MDIKLLFDFVSTFLWPLLLAYGAYLQREISNVQKKCEHLQDLHHQHVAQANKDFATREVVSDLENKLTTVLNRIDDKVTRILGERK
jgi:predicted DNA repair protein MutK